MKNARALITIAILTLLLLNAVPFGFSLQAVKAGAQNTLSVQLYNIGAGQSSLTNNPSHSSSYAAKLVIPSGAPQGSGCMVLYPYNKVLNSLQSFQVYTSYTTALPRFVILLDTNSDGLTDIVLLSDYQFTSDGDWQITQGGQRWGWTEASPALSTYGETWNVFSYWKGIYGNATVLSVGIALEYWAVKDANGLNQPLYADELVINGVTYNIANQPANGYDDWSMFRHDPRHTGSSSSLPSDSVMLWRFNTGDKIRSSAAIVNGVVYDASNNGYVYALNAATGAVIWQYDSGSQVESSPTVVDGVVYVGILWNGNNGYVCALNATTGSLIWRFATNSGIESSPTVVNGVVYIGSYYGYIYALNATNGALIWTLLTGGPVFSSPAVVNGVVYIGSGGGYVYALNAFNGAIIWYFHPAGKVYSSPSVVNGVVYIGSDDGNVYALRATDGSEIWRYTTGGYVQTSPAVVGGVVYVGSNDAYVYALNATTGARCWSFRSPRVSSSFTSYVYSSPAVVGNVVYVGSYDGCLYALNTADGSIIWAYQTGGYIFSSPAIANGVVYIGSFDGKIYALGTPTIVMIPPSPTLIVQQSTASLSASTSTPTPTASPTPAPASQPAQNPSGTVTTLPNQASSLISSIQPTPKPVVSDSDGDLYVNWVILGAIVATAVIALLSLLSISRGNDNTSGKRYALN